MENRRQLGGQNRGASLIQVMIAIVFVLTMGSIVLETTWTNIRMREVELSGKKNFYSAEEVLDDLKSGLSNVAAEALQKAYTAVLADYSSVMTGGGNVQKEFAKGYLDELTAEFKSGAPEKDAITLSADTKAFGGYYDVDKLKDGMTAERDKYIKTGEDEAKFLGDYETGDFTLQNIKIDYTDTRGYETSLSTDMVFHTPTLNFDGSYRVTDYMKYGLVADKGILIDVPNVVINGNIYAGAEGIRCSESGAVISGSNIVTRGDVTVENGGVMTVGDGSSRIWAENAGTTGKGEASSLTLDGNCYIADDLMLDGKSLDETRKSTVTLKGRYYGYNFQKEYDSPLAEISPAEVSADFSSAIMINGEGSALDLSGLTYLLLAGRTYISRGGSGSLNNDIMLGESLSVRTNQLAYSVPEEFLSKSYAPDGSIESADFSGTGLGQYSARIGISEAEIQGYLDRTAPIAIYYYRDGSLEKERYYLNFASEQDANDFFRKYWTVNSAQLSGYADMYADAIVVNDAMIYTLKGERLFKNSGESFKLPDEKITIAPGDWQPDGIYWDYAKQLAGTYKSLQMYLADSNTKDANTEDDGKVRIYDESGAIDKTAAPLMENLLDVGAIKSEHPAAGIVSPETFMVDGTEYNVVIVNNGGAAAYEVAPGYKGIVIATGDVRVQGSFTGMLVSGGTVTFLTGASVTSDELLLSKLFEADANRPDTDGDGKPDTLFAHYFKDYNAVSESVIGTVQIEDYITYENWTKNEG